MIGKVSLIDPEISPNPPLIFCTMSQKNAESGMFFNITQL